MIEDAAVRRKKRGSMEKVRIGILGLGAISGIYLKNLTTVFKETQVLGIYDLIPEKMEQAQKEYEAIPPEPYYRDGYNLYRRMEKYMENHLLFLKEPGVPSTNNEAERRLRPYKRKQAQAVTFRSFESLDQLCQCMSMLVMMREKEGQNIFQKVCGIFG